MKMGESRKGPAETAPWKWIPPEPPEETSPASHLLQPGETLWPKGHGLCGFTPQHAFPDF